MLNDDLMNVHAVGTAIDRVDIVRHVVSTTLPKNSNDDPIYDVPSNLVTTLQLLNAMLHYLRQRCVFNISSETETSRHTLIYMQEKVLQVQRRYLPGHRFDVPMSVLDNNLATNQLRWAPKVTLDDRITGPLHT
ncbi:hypothetical protein SAMN05216303_104318 [Rhodoferax sp. OV413]|uniref:hypothetical protein n=1 Tax=Rhodoferax sp. OV413 TaxID=1855285 RepID=UPI000886A9AD|nr:hypothetical protein [Rhodoferax sp. OV413]SDP44961.1 hypothetical protein SAMN05216303_104318 [Rhodoferax sp. OV413]